MTQNPVVTKLAKTIIDDIRYLSKPDNKFCSNRLGFLTNEQVKKLNGQIPKNLIIIPKDSK